MGTAQDISLFLSEPDEGLVATSTRDPLGFELIWTHFGGRVVPHLSTVSTGATNFGVLLVSLWIIETFLEKHPDFKAFDARGQRRPALEGLVVVTELLHIFSALEKLEAAELRNLLGSDNAKRRVHKLGDALTVGPFDSDQVLSRQLGLGIYGRYRIPLSSMGLIEKRTQRLTPRAYELFASAFEPHRALQAACHVFFETLLTSPCQQRFSSFPEAAQEAFASLRRPRVRARFVAGLTAALEVDEGSALVQHVYEALPVSEKLDAAATLSVLAEQLNESYPQQTERVRDVIRLEGILLQLETLFDRLFYDTNALGEDDEIASTAHNALRTQLDDFDLLLSRHPLPGLVNHRLKKLRQVAAAPSVRAALEVLVTQYHRDTVASSRGAGEWVSLEWPNAMVMNGAYDPRPNPERRWGRRYYLDTLRAFKFEVQEALDAGVAP